MQSNTKIVTVQNALNGLYGVIGRCARKHAARAKEVDDAYANVVTIAQDLDKKANRAMQKYVCAHCIQWFPIGLTIVARWLERVEQFYFKSVIFSHAPNGLNGQTGPNVLKVAAMVKQNVVGVV